MSTNVTSKVTREFNFFFTIFQFQSIYPSNYYIFIKIYFFLLKIVVTVLCYSIKCLSSILHSLFTSAKKIEKVY